MNSRYQKSNELLKHALKLIPLGSQTFSKSYTQYPEGAAPLFLQKGKGGHVWDIDDNEYVDLVCGLLPITLGYCDQDVDQAIVKQLKKGISFSLATELEIELAEKLVDIIPCAEMMRYAKNGSDATSAAIRLARAYTKKERVAFCGYHGWHNWYIGATSRNLGVPKSVSELSHRFEYNNIDSLHQLFRQYRGEFAAIIMEPMNKIDPEPGFLNAVQELAHQESAVFILDEIITGFRYSLGGAQELFNITPDLATFGKGMANGMPLSAVVGRAEIMNLMEHIFFSGTFGGEALSLAAAIATIDKIQKKSVIKNVWSKGEILMQGVQAEIKSHSLENIFSISGKAPWTYINVANTKNLSKEMLKTLFIQEMLKQGVLIQSTHNICYAHSEADIKHVLSAYRYTFDCIKTAIDERSVEAQLACAPIEPVFQVRG